MRGNPDSGTRGTVSGANHGTAVSRMNWSTDEHLGLMRIPLAWMLTVLALLTAVSPWTASASLSRVVVVAQTAVGGLLVVVCVAVVPKGRAPWHCIVVVSLLGGYLALHGLIDRVLNPQHAGALAEVVLVLRSWLPYLWFGVCGYLVRDDTLWHAVLRGLLVGELLMSAGVVLNSIGALRSAAVPYWGSVASNGPYNANLMAANLTLGLVCLDYMVRRHKRSGLIRLEKGMMLLAIVLTFSRTGYAAVVALLIARVFDRVDLLAGLAFLLFAGLALFGETSVAQLVAGRVSYTWVHGALDVSSSTRILLWSDGLRNFWRHPLWGIGLANSLELSPATAYLEASMVELRYQHNQLISLLAETGLAGALLWLWWAFSIWRVSKSAGSLERRILRLTLTVLAIASLTGDPFFSTPTVWVIFMLVAGGVFGGGHVHTEGVTS